MYMNVKDSSMTVATVSSKGQITLPSAARREAGIKLRDRVYIESRNGEIIVRPVPDLMVFKGFAGKALPREAERETTARAVAAHEAKNR
jgi:AbrB family looped-hinge helix DNA binding protein